MAEATASVQRIRIGPRKARLVADLIRGKKVHEARDILAYKVKKASPIIGKLLESAVANAENRAAEAGERINSDDYVVRTIHVDGGPVYKRWHFASRGRGMRILKRTSHIRLVISDS
jgi:large subunit ribosomal protein L22